MRSFIEYAIVAIISIPAGFLLAAIPYLLGASLIRMIPVSLWKARLMLSPYLEIFCGLGTGIALIFSFRLFHLAPSPVTLVALLGLAFVYFNQFKPSNFATLDLLRVPHEHRYYLFGIRSFLAWMSWTMGMVIGWLIIVTRFF